MDDEPRVTEISLTESLDPEDVESMPPPRGVSLRRITQGQRTRQRKWRETHIDPLKNLIKWGVPARALGLYGRWWQLERWIRDLVQLELQSCYRADWKSKVERPELRRAAEVPALIYMPSADDSNPLGFADLGDLGQLIEAYRGLFDYALPPGPRWTGLLSTLGAVRRRIAHCRVSHDDDLSRVEQALRDLEAGAVDCLKSYSSVEWVTPASDPLLASLLNDHSRNAHALHGYDTRFHMHKSHRPWSTCGSSGLLYHARWNCGKYPPDIERVWEYLQCVDNLEMLVHLNVYAYKDVEAVLTPSDGVQSAELINSIFEAVLTSQRRQPDEWFYSWPESVGFVDYRVHLDDYFANAMDFSNGGAVFFWPDQNTSS